MEKEGAGYLFLKTQSVDKEALFIRCTEAPIDQMRIKYTPLRANRFRFEHLWANANSTWPQPYSGPAHGIHIALWLERKGGSSKV
jgi:hypothetical protein